MPDSRKPRFTTSSHKRGFSLVELVVAVGVFVTLSATFLFNYGSFDRRITVDILAHQIAVWIHDAQVSAMSIKRSQGDQTKFPGYGIHFSTRTAPEKSKFLFFADTKNNNKNRLYDPLVGNERCGDLGVECEKEVILTQGNTVSSLCGDQPSNPAQVAPDCFSATAGTLSLYSTQDLDIVFARPNPYDATLYGDKNPVNPTPFSHAEITVSSPRGYRHTITVWTTGQVSVR